MNCNGYLNPSEKLVLKSSCMSCVHLEPLEYEWSLVPVSVDSSVQTLAWAADSTTGQYSSNLVLRSDLFSSQQEEAYQLVLKVTRLDGTSGSATHSFQTNVAPSSGVCEISPLEGVVLQTKFNVTCEGFVDRDNPLSYQMYHRNSDEGADSLFYHGYDSLATDLFLPLGNKDTHLVYMTIIVSDTYGASSKVILSAVVRKPDLISIDDLSMLAVGEGSELNKMIASGDNQAATQLVMSVSSVLNAEGMPDNGEPSGTAKNKRSQLRENLVKSLANVRVSSVETLQQTTAALSEVTKSPGELTESAQSSAAGLLQDMANFLVAQTHTGEHSGSLEGTGKLLLGSVSSVIVATQKPGNPKDTLMYENVTTEGEILASKQHTRNVTKASLSALTDIKSVLLSGKVPGEAPFVVITDSLLVQMSKRFPDDLPRADASVFGHLRDNESESPVLNFWLPQNFSFAEDIEEISTEVVQFEQNPYTWSESSALVTSQVTDIVLGNNNMAISMSNLSQPISIFIPFSKPTSRELSNIPLAAGGEGFLLTEILRSGSGLLLVLYGDVLNDTDLAPEEDTGFRTDSDSSEALQIKLWSIVCEAENTSGSVYNNSRYTFFRSSDIGHNSTGNLTVTELAYEKQLSLRELPGLRSDPCMIHVPSEVIQGAGLFVVQLYTTNTTKDVTITLSTVQTSCLYWEEDGEYWTTNGCQVGAGSSVTHLHCECTHLTSFAGGLFVMPNTLNLKDDLAMFLEFWTNPVGIAVVCGVLAVYVASMVWARRKDRIYRLKALPVDLMDNNLLDGYVYMLTVYTGSRRGACTTSPVTAIIYGSNSESSPHVLECSAFPVFQQGDINFFLVRTAESLGDVNALRFWHHNKGDNPAWYVSRAAVYDVLERKEYHFMCDSWLAVDIGEGILDKTFPVATELEMKNFRNLFLSSTTSGFKDRHMWFSALSRHAHSSFTCVQRVSCCLSLFMSYMLSNIMFYGVDPEPGEQRMDLGPFTITWTELRIGLQSSILMFPLSYLIVVLFRSAKPRHAIMEPWREHLDMAHMLLDPGLQQSSEPNAEAATLGISDEEPHEMIELANIESKITRSNLKSNDELACDDVTIRLKGDIMEHNKPMDNISTEGSLCPAPANSGCVSNDSESSSVEEPIYCGSRQESEDDLTPSSSKIQSFYSVIDHMATDVIARSHQSSKMSFKSVLTRLSRSRSYIPSDTAAPSRHSLLRGMSQLAKVPMPRDSQVSVDDNSSAESFISCESQLVNTSKSLGGQSGEMGRSPLANDTNHSASDGINMQSISNKNETRKLSINSVSSSWAQSHSWHEGRVTEPIVSTDDILVLDGDHSRSSPSNPHSSITVTQIDHKVNSSGKKKCVLPWWTVFIAWFLVVAVSSVCAFFTILYTFNFGVDLSLQWAISLVTSWLSDLVVAQPTKVIGLAVFVSLVTRKPEKMDHINEEALGPEHTDKEKSKELALGIQRWLREDPSYVPPKQTFLHHIKERQALERRIDAIGLEIVRYLVFLYLVLLIAYAQLDANTYGQNEGVSNLFLKDGSFNQIKTMENFWAWANSTVIGGLYDEMYAPYLSNQISFRVGVPRLRQIRLNKERDCGISAYRPLSPCYWRYSMEREDTSSYNGSWTVPVTGPAPVGGHTDIWPNMWTYQTSQDAGGTSFRGLTTDYPGSGYLAFLGSSPQEAKSVLSYLHSAHWIDSNTAALALEFSVYTPNVNLLTTVTMTLEQPPSGGFWTGADIYSMKMYRTTSSFHYFVIVFELLYCVYTIHFIVCEVKDIKRKGQSYFTNKWNYIALSAILTSLAVVALYVSHMVEVSKAVHQFVHHGTKPSALTLARNLDAALSYMFGFLVTIAMIKFLHLLRFNPVIHKFACALKSASGPLAGLTGIMLIFIFSYASMMHLLTGTEVGMFYSIPHAMKGLFLAVLKNFDMGEIAQFDEFWGPMLFLIYVCTAVFLIFNLLITCLLVALQIANRNPQPSDDTELLWLLFDKVKQWLGVRNARKESHAML